MEFSQDILGQEEAIIGLFQDTFTASEGAEEGQLVGALTRALLICTPPRDRHVVIAWEGGDLIGGAIFSRLTYPNDPRTVFILSPMAVATAWQGQGIGQALINHALRLLRQGGVDVVMTYGDPAFYGKVGFQQLTDAIAAAPRPLSRPEGWIGQSLAEETFAPLDGPCCCVEALNDPALW